MPKKYNNIIYKLFLKSKKIIKVILSNITRIGLIVYIEDPKKVFSVDYIYIKKDIKVKKTTKEDIITTSHFIKSNTTSIINLDTSQVGIQQKRNNIYIY